MIEPIMYMGIGFLVAGLLVIGAIPLVHARAVRLTMKRLEAMTPMSMAEIQADKDQLRAEFAMSTRRLEMSVEQMKAKTTRQLAEIGKKTDAIGRLKFELGEKTAALLELEDKHAPLTEDLNKIREQLVAKTRALEETERVVAETQSELAKISGDLNDSTLSGDSQRIDMVTLHAQVDMFKEQVAGYENNIIDLRGQLAQTNSELETTTQNLAEERAKAETFTTHIDKLERLLVAQTTEGEILTRRVQELMVRLEEQGRFLAEHEYSAEQLRDAAKAAQKTESDVRTELAEAEERRRQTAEALRAERVALEEQLRHSIEERGKLEREIAKMKREAETTWANERMENAVLRERLNDVAAEVARLTSALEGPNSPIETILASEASHAGAHGSGERPFAASGRNGQSAKGSLADRIRALQSRAARIAQTG